MSSGAIATKETSCGAPARRDAGRARGHGEVNPAASPVVALLRGPEPPTVESLFPEIWTTSAPPRREGRIQNSLSCEEATPRAGELPLEIALMLAAHMAVVAIIVFVLDGQGIH